MSIPTQLPMACAIGLFAVFIVERVLHALVWLCVSLITQPTLAEPASMASMARGVLGGSVNMGVDLVRMWVSAFAGLAQWALYYAPVMLIFFLWVWIMSLVMSTQTESVRNVVSLWNNGMSTVLRSTVIVPLQILNLVFQALVPFWNAISYFLRGLLYAVAVPMLQVNMDPVLKSASAGGDVIKELALSLVSFSQSLGPCTDSGCLSAGVRVFDFLTPMVYVRLMVSYALLFSRDACSVITPVLDLVAYPFLDSNFAQALHAGLNAPLYAVVQLPLVTYARCSQAANDTDTRLRSLACTPDVVPIFNFAAASARYAGILMDNWLDVTWVTILSVFGKAPASCDPSPVSLKFLAEQLLFGGNETRLVGLGTTSYALTDGNSVQYLFYRGATEPVQPVSPSQPCLLLCLDLRWGGTTVSPPVRPSMQLFHR
jgi:hypothetical protein